MSDNAKTRENKLIELCIPFDKQIAFTDTALDIMYDRIMTNKNTSTDEKKLLYFLNKILEELGMSQQSYLEDIEIDRKVALNLNGIDFIKKNKDEIIDYGVDLYDDLGYASRNAVKSYGITIIRGLVKHFGYKISVRHKCGIDNDRPIRYASYVIKK